MVRTALLVYARPFTQTFQRCTATPSNSQELGQAGTHKPKNPSVAANGLVRPLPCYIAYPHSACPGINTRCNQTTSITASATQRGGSASTFSEPSKMQKLEGVHLRIGRPSDLPFIWLAVAKEKINPLNLVSERFVVATVPRHSQGAASGNDTVIGCGQVKPLSSSQASASNDSTSSPAGKDWELSTLVVAPHYRGRGIGSQIVNQLLSRVPASDRVHLITIRSRVAFYERCGFVVVQDPANIPSQLAFEMRVGSMVARWAVGEELALLSWTAPT